MQWKFKYGVIAVLLGASLFGLNLVAVEALGHQTFGTLVSTVGALSLIILGLWDLIEYKYQQKESENEH